MSPTGITAPAIMPDQLTDIAPMIERAEILADALVHEGRFDAVADFARILPLSIMVELLACQIMLRAMLEWADATFNLFEEVE